jgi:hypothetical protein
MMLYLVRQVLAAPVELPGHLQEHYMDDYQGAAAGPASEVDQGLVAVLAMPLLPND